MGKNRLGLYKDRTNEENGRSKHQKGLREFESKSYYKTSNTVYIKIVV